MDTITVRYVGPNSESSKREMKVSSDEADRLEETGLWKRKTKSAPKPAKNKGDS